MTFIPYCKLSVMTIEDELETLSFDLLGGFLQEHPANVVYIEFNGRLYGIFSSGTIRRALKEGKREIKIRRSFTKVAPGEYMRALQIFHNDDRINAIPIVTSDGLLKGEYSRCDEAIKLAHDNPDQLEWLNSKYADSFFREFPIIMVKPAANFDWKMTQFNLYKKLLQQKGADVTVIERQEIRNLDRGCVFLFSDMDELDGAKALNICITNTLMITGTMCTTYANMEEFGPLKDKFIIPLVEDCLLELQKRGLFVITLQSVDNGSNYSRELRERVDERFASIHKQRNVPTGQVEPEFFRDFFADFYTEEYAREIASIPFDSMAEDGIVKLQDTQSKYYNVVDHKRVTIGQPMHPWQDICFYGPCVIVGNATEDRHTIESFLQDILNRRGIKARVSNYGAWSDVASEMERIVQTPFKEGDIVVLYLANLSFPDIPNINLMDIMEEANIPAEYIADIPIHANYIVNAVYADAIYKRINQHLLKEYKERKPVERCITPRISQYLNLYFSEFEKMEGQRIGSIVMNCNPFTKGHRYLIEAALKQVDFLIIFVVEEDKSLFPFRMRYSFVKAGTDDLENVMVVPSGNFILSQTTFPEYFMKVADEDIVQNVEYDVALFAEQIAPHLGITCRFVGEEPEDGVTREYNEAMKRILPANGIEVIEIPRITLEDGQIISATTVRKCLENNDIEQLDRLIPESTKRILFWENR